MLLRPPLTRCPVCNYSLAGLPPAHNCPECGYEYDESTLILRPTRRWGPVSKSTLAWVIGIYLLGIPMLSPVIATLPPRAMKPAALFLLAIFVAIIFVAIFPLLGRKRFASIGPRKLILRTRGPLIELNYDDISAIALNDFPPSITRRGGEPIALRHMFDSNSEKQQFADGLINARSGAAPVVSTINQAPPPITPPSKTPLNLPALIMSVAVFGIATAMVGIFVTLIYTIIRQPKSDPPILGVLVLLFWICVPFALWAVWNSDKRTKKKNQPPPSP